METRLNLLCDAGVIDKDICKGMMQVVNVLETECHLPVRSEQGTMAMTHMASALMRSRRGEEIEPLDAELLAELPGLTVSTLILRPSVPLNVGVASLPGDRKSVE